MGKFLHTFGMGAILDRRNFFAVKMPARCKIEWIELTFLGRLGDGQCKTLQ